MAGFRRHDVRGTAWCGVWARDVWNTCGTCTEHLNLTTSAPQDKLCASPCVRYCPCYRMHLKRQLTVFLEVALFDGVSRTTIKDPRGIACASGAVVPACRAACETRNAPRSAVSTRAWSRFPYLSIYLPRGAPMSHEPCVHGRRNRLLQLVARFHAPYL